MAAPARSPYRIYRVSGKPIFAAPLVPRGLRRAGVLRYQPVTPRRAAFRSLMSLSMLARADWLLGTTADDPVGAAGFDFQGWMDEVRGQLGERGATGVVIWPPQQERARIYVHLFNERLRPIGFAKVAFDEHNAQCLKREAQTLRELEQMRLTTVRVPRILAMGTCGAAFHLVVEPIPENARPLPAPAEFPARCVEEFAGPPRLVPAERLGELSWWTAHERHDATAPAFAAELRELLAGGLSVCRAHGDLGPSNIVHDGKQLWIFDWEEARTDGPELADEVTFCYGMQMRLAARDPKRCVDMLRERFLRGGDPRRRVQVMLALAFRRALGMPEATGLIECWEATR